MEEFNAFLSDIQDIQHQKKLAEVFDWIKSKFPFLTAKIAWNQPMFSNHGTFIIAFSVAKDHFSVAPEKAGIQKFAQEIVQAGYRHTEMLFRVKWTDSVDFPLLEKIIQFNISDKENCTTFWR